MTANIITFADRKNTRPNTTAKTIRNNIISFDAWRNCARPYRTAAGVFFVTPVLRTVGDAA